MAETGKTIRLTRRRFLSASAAASAALTVAGCGPGAAVGRDLLTDTQARTLATLCDQIVPADDFTSASQAGVVDYIDRQLARVYRRHQEAYRDGLAQAAALSQARFGRAPEALGAVEQLALATELEQKNPVFFNLLREHTMEGYYGAPRHGGNRDAVSWRMLGLDVPPLRGRAQYDLGKGGAQ
ncbi:MAG: gluconate 2-dehydrogenase subunit 3 family protein [Terracidiphilus sp.]